MAEKKVQSGLIKNFKGLAIVVLVGAIIFNSIQLWNMNRVVERVDKYNQGVVDEIGQFKGNIKLFADDLNGIREFLLLPVKNYSKNDAIEQKPQDEQSSSENQLAIYAFLDNQAKGEKMASNKLMAEKFWQGIWSDENYKNQLIVLGLKIQFASNSDLQVKFLDDLIKNQDGSENSLKGQALFNLVYVPEENLFKWQSVLGDTNLQYLDEPEAKAKFTGKISDLINQQIKQVREEKISRQKKQEEIAKIDTAKDLLEMKKNELEMIFKETAFQDTLKTAGLQLSNAPRAENNKIIYEVLDSTGKVKYAFALEISSGLVKVLKDNEEIDIRTFLNAEGLKKKP